MPRTRATVTSRKTGIDLDADEFLSALDQTVRRMKLRSVDELEGFAQHAAVTIRSKAPSGATGDLREGIGYRTGRDAQGPYADVFSEQFYGHFLEFGTSRQTARPFFRPGLAEAATQFPSRMRRILARIAGIG